MPKQDTPMRNRWRVALLGLSLPLALASTAQTTDVPEASGIGMPSPEPVLVDVTTVRHQPAAQPAEAPPAVVQSPATAVDTMPLASGFDVREFEAMAQALVEGQRVPALSMAIVHDGQVLSMRGYGITDTEAAEPVGAHTVFRLASLSKGFAGTMAGLLVSEGALRWDSRVKHFLPDFRLHDPQAAQAVTVADLLSHRVGLPHHTYDRAIEANADYRDLVHRLYETPLRCDPGECYTYQNVAFSLIGDVVFAATGTFYSQAVERRLFGPLGMHDASLGLARTCAREAAGRRCARSPRTTGSRLRRGSTPARPTWRNGCSRRVAIARTCCRRHCWRRCTNRWYRRLRKRGRLPGGARASTRPATGWASACTTTPGSGWSTTRARCRGLAA